MKRMFSSAVLAAAMTGLIVASSGSFAPAQDKTKTDPKAKVDPKADPKATAKTEDKLGSVEVYMAKDGWRWKVLNADGKTIAMGTTGFEKKEDALKTVENVKNTLNKAKIDVKEEKK